MVGIVVVSHSRALARAAVALAREMAPEGSVHLGIAAGLDERTFGTDAAAIAAAVLAADVAGGGDGVLVLMDLGSAVLSAELALELLPDGTGGVDPPGGSIRDRVELCAAAAAGGASLSVVAAEASAALAAKQAHLGVGPPPGDVSPSSDSVRAEFTVIGEHGLHARPAALLVRRLQPLDAVVQLRNLTTGAGPVSAGSLLGVTTLGAVAGHRVEVTASGPRAGDAVDLLLRLAGQGFDGEDVPPGAGPSVPV